MAGITPACVFRICLDLSSLRPDQADVEGLAQLPTGLVIYAVELARADEH